MSASIGGSCVKGMRAVGCLDVLEDEDNYQIQAVGTIESSHG